MTQFQFANIPGQFQQGQQFAQTNAMNKEKISQAKMQTNEAQSMASLTGNLRSALNLQAVPNDQKRDHLMQSIAQGESEGRDMTQSRKALDLVVEGRYDELEQGTNQLRQVGQGLGLLKRPTDRADPGFTLGAGQQRFDASGNKIAEVGSSEEQKKIITIRQQESELRAAELEDKKIERQLKIETNQLKKDELQTKLEQNKIKTAQDNRNIKFDAQSSVDAVTNSVDTIDRLLKGSGLESAAGVQANFPTISGSTASDFETTLDTLQSQAFLSQVEKMKGMGSLSENEGKKLGAALGSLSINQSDKALRSELGRIKVILNKAKARMQIKFGISAVKTGPLDADELAELNQLKAELK